MLVGLFKKEVAGIYFSSKGITIVQQGLGRIKNHLCVPYPSLIEGAGGILSDNIFDIFKNKDIELVAFLQKAIRDSKVETNDIIVALPPKDLIIRFFEMPNIPKSEIMAGINFEMKKYIPFKTEELAFDFQYRIKHKANIIEVILCGMKQDLLDRYTNLFKQLNLKVVAYEPGLFSLFRLLLIRNKDLNHKSCIILDYDKEEANILIEEKGFAYFMRDIKLVSSWGSAKTQEEMDAVLFRLINEVRVSLDYYKRQFLKKDVDEMIIVCDEIHSEWAENFNKELGLKVDSIALSEFFKVRTEEGNFYSDVSKAFGATLRIQKPLLVTLNLAKVKEKAEKVVLLMAGVTLDNLIETFITFLRESKSVLLKSMVAGVIMFLVIYGHGFSKVFPLEKELAAVSVKQPPLLPGVDSSSYERVKASEKVFVEKESEFRKLIENYTPFYKKLVILPHLLPNGVWLNTFSYASAPATLRLNCFSYANDEKTRTDNVNQFIMNLKTNEEFSKDFPLILLKAYKEVKSEAIYYIQFDVSCESKG